MEEDIEFPYRKKLSFKEQVQDRQKIADAVSKVDNVLGQVVRVFRKQPKFNESILLAGVPPVTSDTSLKSSFYRRTKKVSKNSCSYTMWAKFNWNIFFFRLKYSILKYTLVFFSKHLILKYLFNCIFFRNY